MKKNYTADLIKLCRKIADDSRKQEKEGLKIDEMYVYLTDNQKTRMVKDLYQTASYASHYKDWHREMATQIDRLLRDVKLKNCPNSKYSMALGIITGLAIIPANNEGFNCDKVQRLSSLINARLAENGKVAYKMKHREPIKGGVKETILCSACGCELPKDNDFKHCPNCGYQFLSD